MALLVEGFPTFLTPGVGGLAGVLFREKEVQPYGLDSGGPIETTNMRNVIWRTRASKTLRDTESIVGQVLYDPAIYATFLTLIGVITSWAITFPDSTVHTMYGWMDKFTPQSHKEGELPLAEIRIIPSNSTTRNPTGETGPT